MKTIAEIEEIRKSKREELDLRVNENTNSKEKHILVCKGTGCTSSKSPKIIETLRKLLEEKGITNVRVIQTGCFGLCSKGPIVIVRPEEVFAKISPVKFIPRVMEIINTTISGTRVTSSSNIPKKLPKSIKTKSVRMALLM